MTNYDEVARLVKKGRRAETRRKAIEGAATQFVISILTYLFRGFWLMLAVAFARAYWLPQMPALSYWRAVVIVGLLAGIFSAVPTVKEVKS